MRRFLAPEVPEPGARLTLEPGPSHHLLRVTGVARGEQVGLYDGRGRGGVGVLVEILGGLAIIEVLQVETAAPPRPLWLLVGLLKSGTMDEVVRQATELGVSHIVPVLADRSVARGERVDRWLRVAEAAVGQCGRAAPPEIFAPCSLTDAIALTPTELDRRVYAPNAPRQTAPDGPAALLIGPEGGLSGGEIAKAESSGFLLEGLGPLTLRADTAVTAVLARAL